MPTDTADSKAATPAPHAPDAFQSFHAALCRRFGYAHDEIDWRRDLCSLEEHIAKQAEDLLTNLSMMQAERNIAQHEAEHERERKRWWIANCEAMAKERKLLRDAVQCALGGLCVAALKDGMKEMLEHALKETDLAATIEEHLKKSKAEAAFLAGASAQQKLAKGTT